MAEIRGASKLGIKVEGLKELQSQFNRIGKMPKKYLSKAAREGMAAPEKDAKASAPVGKTGILKKSIKKKMETPNKRNKAVYRLRYDPKYTEQFLKPTTGAYGGVTPNAYYPASVEYGYKGKYGTVIPKTQFWLSKTLKKHETDSLQKVINSLNSSINTLTKQSR